MLYEMFSFWYNSYASQKRLYFCLTLNNHSKESKTLEMTHSLQITLCFLYSLN